MDPEIFEMLLEISRHLAETRELDPLLKQAMRSALDLVGAKRGYLVLVGEDGSLDFRVRLDNRGKEMTKPEAQISRSILNDVIQKREAVVLADASGSGKYVNEESIGILQLRSVMCVPLTAGGQTFGALYVENRSARNVFTREALNPLTYLAAQAAVSIQNAMLNENLEERVQQRTDELAQANRRLRKEVEERRLAEERAQKMAMTDSLTQIYNRRYFFGLAQAIFSSSEQGSHEMSVILMDIDHFKAVNDTFGHAAGDEALKEFTRRVAGALREGDVFARYGGEEFVVLLQKTGADKAENLAEKVRKAVCRKPILKDKKSVTITVSLGIATRTDEDSLTLDKLIERADNALYRAKQNGRNQVQVWTPEENPGEG
jgi:diguanylate cyclase (GGDEF)-like protein